jgi:hypothetical protein
MFSTSSAGCTSSGTGFCVVDANQAANANYSAATQVSQTTTLGGASQAIAFTSSAPTPGVFGTTYAISATGGASGNAVTFSTASAGCTTSGTNGSTITFTSGTGSCVVDANQAGNANYLAAPQVSQTTTLGLASQAIAITSTAPTPGEFGTTYTITATGGGSGNAVTFSSSSAGCTASGTNGSTITFSSATGTCVVDADQAGDTNYSAAPQISQSITLGLASQTIVFTSSAPTPGGMGTTYTITATGGGSGNPVLFSTSSAGCTATGTNGSTITFTASAGTCVVDANQAGSTNYNTAPQVSQSITLGMVPGLFAFGEFRPALKCANFVNNGNNTQQWCFTLKGQVRCMGAWGNDGSCTDTAAGIRIRASATTSLPLRFNPNVDSCLNYNPNGAFVTNLANALGYASYTINVAHGGNFCDLSWLDGNGDYVTAPGSGNSSLAEIYDIDFF